MILLSKRYKINLDDYQVKNEKCFHCLRFIKTALKEKSPLFVKLNALINPVYDRILEGIVTAEELDAAKSYARESTQPGNSGP